MAYDNLRQTITGNIYSNNSQEITGDTLQEVLLEVVQVMEDEDQELENSLSNVREKSVTPSQMAAAIKSEVNLINETFETKADIDKTYPKMTAGFAQEIVGDGSATPEEFSFRPTAGEDRNVANTTYYDGERNGVARIEKIKGNSVVANNCMGNNIGQNGYFLTRYEDGSFLVKRNPEVTSGRYFSDFFAYDKKFINHKYAIIVHYVAYNIVEGNYISINFFNLTTGQYGPYIIQNGEGITTTIVTCTNTTTTRPTISYGPDGEEEILIKSRYAIDLTKMFGADNEPTTVEEFWQRLPQGIDLSQYDEGTIIDGNYGGIKTVGFNAFNGTYAKVCTGCSYYLGGNYTSLGFTTEEGGTLEAVALPSSTESVGTTPSDRLYTPLQNGYIYAEGTNININISWDTEYGYLNGTYQPYKPFERNLSWIKTIKDSTGNAIFKNGMRSAGSVRDEIRFNSTTQKWEAVQNVGVRAYAEGDTEDTSVTTDGTNTNYALATPIVTEITEDINMDFDVSDYGTEELIVEEGVASAPILADITYAPNALSTLKQVPEILKRLKALESAVASATATTNEEETVE